MSSRLILVERPERAAVSDSLKQNYVHCQKVCAEQDRRGQYGFARQQVAFEFATRQ